MVLALCKCKEFKGGKWDIEVTHFHMSEGVLAPQGASSRATTLCYWMMSTQSKCSLAFEDSCGWTNICWGTSGFTWNLCRACSHISALRHLCLSLHSRTFKSWWERYMFLKARKPCTSGKCRICMKGCCKQTNKTKQRKQNEIERSFLYKSTAISSKGKPLENPDIFFFFSEVLSSRR